MTAAAARAAGLNVVLVLTASENPPAPKLQGNLLLDELFGAISRAFRALNARFMPRTFAGWLWRERLGAWGIGLALGLFLIVALGPFYLIIVTAFKTNTQITGFRSPLWPEPWSLQQFNFIVDRTDFTTWFRNTVLISRSS